MAYATSKFDVEKSIHYYTFHLIPTQFSNNNTQVSPNTLARQRKQISRHSRTLGSYLTIKQRTTTQKKQIHKSSNYSH